MASEATFFTISVDRAPAVPCPGRSPYQAARLYALANSTLPAGTILALYEQGKRLWAFKLKWNKSKHGTVYPQFSDVLERG